jgi:hypothetical protein
MFRPYWFIVRCIFVHLEADIYIYIYVCVCMYVYIYCDVLRH